ncbi:MAG TPA: extensin family protein [Hyphomicrobiaceae bacterium]|jgi:hypothetical protein|nr:extensin family protein [Hyphomicrobiaceae bacterium]
MPTRTRRFPLLWLILVVLIGLGGAALLRQGLVPPALNPLPALDLAQSEAWFVDWRLAALKHDPQLCRRILAQPQISAEPIPDNPPKQGCGWTNSVRMSSAGGVHAAFDKATCEAAAALALWLTHDVQAIAQEIFGQRVVAIQSFGSYACRNIIGNPFWKDIRSEHATANALDISGFTLAGGRQIGVLQHWKGTGAEARFLRAVHARACRYFHVVLGPEYNAAHHNHFHLDRGVFWRCT